MPKKGQSYSEEWRTIKTIVIPLWAEICSEAKNGQILFSIGLKPSDQPIRTEQIGRRWKRHIKNKLAINSDFYRLKHLNTPQVMDALSEKLAAIMQAEEEAAGMNGHTTTAMVRSIYDTKNKLRRTDLIKEVKTNSHNHSPGEKILRGYPILKDN